MTSWSPSDQTRATNFPTDISDRAAVGLDGWTISDCVEIIRSNEDVDGSPISGSIQVMQLRSNTAFELSQCVPAFGGATYGSSVTMRMSTPSLLSFTRSCEFFAAQACGAPGTGIAVNVRLPWSGTRVARGSRSTEPLTHPVARDCVLPSKSPRPRAGFHCDLDDLFFGGARVDLHGWIDQEDASAWSASVP